MRVSSIYDIFKWGKALFGAWQFHKKHVFFALLTLLHGMHLTLSSKINVPLVF
jgi:hypothetical protein